MTQLRTVKFVIRVAVPLVLALMAAAPLAAQTTGCATAANLAQGINVDFSDGITEVYRAIRPGVTSVTGMDGTAQIYRLQIAQGTHLLDYLEVENGQPVAASHQVYDYGVAPEMLPVPSNGQRFNASVTVTASDGVRVESQVQAYIDADPLVMGACTYSTVEAVIAYETEDNYIESIRYLPQLGIGFLQWSETDNGRGVENVVMSIRTGK